MRQRLDRHHPLQRDRRGGQQVERAILGIQREDPVQRQEAGQQRAHPQDARRDPAQQSPPPAPTPSGTSTATSRKKASPRPNPPPARMASRRSRTRSAIMRTPRRRRRRARADRARNGVRSSTSASASPGRHGWRSAPHPPAARCARTTPANSATEAASSETVGSSSSQTGRPVTRSRASPSRRFCPADRFARRTVAQAPQVQRRQRRLRRRRCPWIAAQNARFSATVSAAFSPSAWAA